MSRPEGGFGGERAVDLGQVLGQSAALVAVREQAARVLRSASGPGRRSPPILLLGETGDKAVPPRLDGQDDRAFTRAPYAHIGRLADRTTGLGDGP